MAKRKDREEARRRRGEEELQRLAAGSATAFAASVLCVYPLYIDNFSNLGLTKYTGVFTLFLLWCFWLASCALLGAKGRRLEAKDGTIASLTAFVAANVLATACSLSPAASLWGLGSYYGGLSMVLFTALGYLFLRSYAQLRDYAGLSLGVGICVILVTVLYVLNIFNIDLIGAYENTAVVERAQFFSTLGQKNFNGGFMAVALPLVFWAFLFEENRLLYAVPAFFGALALAVVDAEGLMLGLGAAALVLICQKRFTLRVLRRAAALGAAFFFWAGFMQYMRTHTYTQGGTPLLASLGQVAAGGFAVCLAAWLFLWWLTDRKGYDPSLYKAGRIMAGLSAGGAAALFLLANCLPGFPSLGKLDNLLVFNDDWGTFRGVAWRAAWGVWADGSVLRKLVGIGPGMMHRAVADWAGDAMTPRMATFYAAHNEYLEQLLTTGLLGLAAWLWFLAAHLRRAAKHWDRPAVAPLTLALVSYLAQAAVSIRVSMIFPGVMVLFALLAVSCGEEEGSMPAPPKKDRYWLVTAAVLSMPVSGLISKLLFGFLGG